MTDYVWVVELAVKPGKVDQAKALMDDMVSSIQENEPGTLNYELFISDNEQTLHIYEQYADGDAFKTHLDNFSAAFADRFGKAVDVSAFTVYGNPNDEIRKILDGFGAVIMSPLVGFAR